MPEARSRYGRLGTNESMAQTAMPRISMRNNVSRTVLPIWEMSDVFAVSVIEQLAVSEGNEVGRGNLELEAAHAGAYVDVGMPGDGGLVVGGEGLLHADGGAASADVSGKRQELLYVDQFGPLVAGDPGGFLEVYLAVALYYAYEISVAVTAQHYGLVYAGDVLTESGCHGIGGEMLFVHFVWYQLIGYSGPVQKAGCVGFL